MTDKLPQASRRRLFVEEINHKEPNFYDLPPMDVLTGRPGEIVANYHMDLETHDYFKLYAAVKGIPEKEVMRRAKEALNNEEIV